MASETITFSNNGETAVASAMQIAQHTPFVALISQTGPFNTTEWLDIVRSGAEEQVGASALDFFKDASLLAEAARAGGGRSFQSHILRSEDGTTQTQLEQIDHQRTHRPVFQLYRDLGIMRNVSAYYVYGRPYDELEVDQQQVADNFGLVTDISHFGRIMGKDGKDVDDVQKTWLVSDFAFALERNLNASFTARAQDEVLYNIPNESIAENDQTVLDRSPEGNVTAIRAQRKTEPNVSFMFSAENARPLAKGVEVPISFGRGDIRMTRIDSTDQLLSYLSTQFDSLLLKYPLEKAALIMDKFIYGRKLGEFGISLSAVQAVRNLEGKMTAKILRVGNAAVGVVRTSSRVNTEITSLAGNKATGFDQLTGIAEGLQLDINDILVMSSEVKKRDRLVGRIMQAAKEQSLDFSVQFDEPVSDSRLGTIQQAEHYVEEVEIDKNTSFILIPPSIAGTAYADNSLRNPKEAGKLASALNAISPGYSFSQERFAADKIQVLDNSPWTQELVVSQLTEFIGKMRELSGKYGEVAIYEQIAHHHPTQAVHGPKQEHSAYIGRVLAEAFGMPNIKVRAGSLVDEYHTSDLKGDYSEFNKRIGQIAGGMFEGTFLESSPRMRILGDALVRMLMSDQNTSIIGGTVVHAMPDGRTLELWDAAMSSAGEFTPGRQACVPFELGMDLALMHPELADDLYLKYLLTRFPQSMLAEFTRTSGRKDSDALMVENIMIPENDIIARNARRMEALNQLDRDSFAEIWQTNPDITAFDIYALDVMYRRLKSDMDSGKRFPVVIHVLETNYNAQQSKSGWLWNQIGIPGIPIYRVSFDSASKKVRILESSAPEEDRMGQWLDKNRTVVEKIREIMEAESAA